MELLAYSTVYNLCEIRSKRESIKYQLKHSHDT